MSTPDEIRAEIAEARRIIREDKIISGHKALTERFDKHFPPDPDGTSPSDPPEGTPPPPDPKPPAPDRDKPRSKWWGDALDGN